MKRRSAARYNMNDARTRVSEVVQKAVGPIENRQASRKLGLAKDIEILPGFEKIPNDFAEYA